MFLVFVTQVSPLQYSEKSTPLQGLDAQLQVSASRQYTFSGMVTSSKGQHTVTVSSAQQMSNSQMMKGNLTAQSVRHNVQLHNKVCTTQSWFLVLVLGRVSIWVG